MNTMVTWLLLGLLGAGMGCSSTTGDSADASSSGNCPLPGATVCPYGTRCPLPDGCNTCLCGDNRSLVLCTTMVCTSDAGTPQDVPPAQDVQDTDVPPATDIPPATDVPPVRDVPPTTDTSPMADAGERQYPDAMLIWQSPGGFAGWGPAVMVEGNGTVRRWQMAREFSSGSVPMADETFQLPGPIVDELFARWSRVNLDGLPHGSMGASDCYPSVTVRLSARGVERTLRYQHPRQLTPEMMEVWQWFVAHTPRVLPAEFCDF